MTFDRMLQYILLRLFSLVSLLSLLDKYSCLLRLHEVFIPTFIFFAFIFIFYSF
jgi:hypothetical protein